MADVDHTKYIPEKQPTQEEVNRTAQDPNHPANPEHPKHSHWVGDMGKKFGNALVFGAGATAGADLVNSVFGR